ncbi:MAG: hypothetical protein HYZ89_03310 [Candidatus Omnitrophica bacterium]|nr:hypothetical protein [Candidatus Omnitrophota bacterium]
MSGQLPVSCQVALKEWTSVLAAYARREQIVFVRKGGLIEPVGFEFRAPRFRCIPRMSTKPSPSCAARFRRCSRTRWARNQLMDT